MGFLLKIQVININFFCFEGLEASDDSFSNFLRV